MSLPMAMVKEDTPTCGKDTPPSLSAKEGECDESNAGTQKKCEPGHGCKIGIGMIVLLLQYTVLHNKNSRHAIWRSVYL